MIMLVFCVPACYLLCRNYSETVTSFEKNTSLLFSTICMLAGMLMGGYIGSLFESGMLLNHYYMVVLMSVSAAIGYNVSHLVFRKLISKEVGL